MSFFSRPKIFLIPIIFFTVRFATIQNSYYQNVALLFSNKSFTSSTKRESLLFQAESWFNKVKDPQNQQLGFIWLAQGKQDKAIIYWQSLKNMGDELVQWGNLADMNNDVEQALAFFKLAELVNPTLPDPYLHTGNLLAQEGHLEEALAAYETANRLDPSKRKIWYEMGLVQFRLKRWRAALNSFERGLEVEFAAGGASSIYYQIGRIYQYSPNMQNFEKALAAYEQAILQNDFLPNTLHKANVHYEIGALFNGRQAWQQAIRSFDEALQIAPYHYWANLGKAVAIWGYGDEERAILLVKSFIEQNPDSADAYKLLGDFYQDLGQNINARAMYEQALTLNPNLLAVKATLESLP